MGRRLLALAAAALVSIGTATPAAACILPTIYFFAHGSDAIDRQSEQGLSAVLSWIQRNADGLAQIRVVGHSDRTGSRGARRAISLARAEAVRDWLISRGAPAPLIVVEAMGDAKPVVVTADGVPEPDNRRVEIGLKLTEAGLAALQARPATPLGAVATC